MMCCTCIASLCHCNYDVFLPHYSLLIVLLSFFQFSSLIFKVIEWASNSIQAVGGFLHLNSTTTNDHENNNIGKHLPSSIVHHANLAHNCHTREPPQLLNVPILPPLSRHGRRIDDCRIHTTWRWCSGVSRLGTRSRLSSVTREGF